jgi:predicted DNA-binding ribbon-helix-helix protein
MTPEEAQLIKELKEENNSTQKMLSEIRTMLSQFIKDERARRRERTW